MYGESVFQPSVEEVRKMKANKIAERHAKELQKRITLKGSFQIHKEFQGLMGIVTYTDELVVVAGTDDSSWEWQEAKSRGYNKKEMARIIKHGILWIRGKDDLIGLYPNYVLFIPGWLELEYSDLIWHTLYERMKYFRMAGHVFNPDK